jgi:hypothetical protein
MSEPIKPRRSAEEIRRIEELRRSSAAGRHDSRVNRRRTRSQDERQARKEQQE